MAQLWVKIVTLRQGKQELDEAVGDVRAGLAAKGHLERQRVLRHQRLHVRVHPRRVLVPGRDGALR